MSNKSNGLGDIGWSILLLLSFTTSVIISSIKAYIIWHKSTNGMKLSDKRLDKRSDNGCWCKSTTWNSVEFWLELALTE